MKRIRTGRHLVRVGLLAVLLPASTALALDGRVDLWKSRQEGGAGQSAYTTSTFWETYGLNQPVAISRRTHLGLDLFARRQRLTSTSTLGSSESRTETVIPSFSLTYRSHGLRGGASGRAMRRDDFLAGGTALRDENVDFNAWLRAETAWLRVEGRLQETASWREPAGGQEVESREHRQSGLVEVRPTAHDELRYTISHSDQDSPTFDRGVTYLSHELRFRSQRRFADRRGRYFVDARGTRLKETTVFRGDQQVVLLPPIWGGVVLDDTPEFLDPLEPDPVLVPALFDGDRDTPTVINIGDSAPVVRQYGGDYRNLIFDFGDVEPMSSMVLYVDRVLRFPELMQWQVYVSDDPEGRDWGQPLSGAAVTVTYTEQANGRQGWIVTFAAPIAHRRVKLVNVKLGETEPDIFVTEMEVYQPAPGAEDSEDVTRLDRYRLQGELAYDILRPLELRYYTSLTGRHFEGENRDVHGKIHLFGATWQAGEWILAGSHEINTVENESGQDTDSRTQRVSLTSPRRADLRGRLHWSRVDDRSYTLQHVANTYAGDLTWQIAPRLIVFQQVSYGERDSEGLLGDSESWGLVTRVDATPRPNIDVYLRRSDRWVSAEAGSGFTTFNESELNVNWALLPLVTLVSQTRYQEREADSGWVLRNTLSWTPLPGGSLATRLYVSDYQDTRLDYLQRGGGVSGVWRARPRLRFEASSEWTLVKDRGSRNTPWIWSLRGTWTF